MPMPFLGPHRDHGRFLGRRRFLPGRGARRALWVAVVAAALAAAAPASASLPEELAAGTSLPLTAPAPIAVPTAESAALAAPAPAPAPPTARRRSGAVTVAQTISIGNTARRSVALTFDAGADRGYAEAILNVLRDEGVRASFGMTGLWAEQHPDLVQRMAAEGHRLINHSYDHASFTGVSSNRRPLTREQRWWQLDRTEEVIVELTGQNTVPLFRSPFGDTDGGVLADIAARGYAYNVLWTVDSRGWMGYSAAAIIRRCLDLAQPGAIYVMHVGAAAQDGPALPAIITGLRDAGYTFETVDEILE
ncbi:MAG: polysaccharide deacetylase family protein [Dehalococcoidia bacterium]